MFYLREDSLSEARSLDVRLLDIYKIQSIVIIEVDIYNYDKVEFRLATRIYLK